jgi:hypothetical protein
VVFVIDPVEEAVEPLFTDKLETPLCRWEFEIVTLDDNAF